jgi:hypothetical protein
MQDRKRLLEILSELSEVQESADQDYITDADQFWKSLTTEQQMYCFYTVVRTITSAELKEEFHSYRKILYDDFGFPSESYYIGMLAGFMELHNSILRPAEMTEYRKLLHDKRLEKKND